MSFDIPHTTIPDQRDPNALKGLATIKKGRAIIFAPRLTERAKIEIARYTDRGHRGEHFIEQRYPGHGFSVVSTKHGDTSIIQWRITP